MRAYVLPCIALLIPLSRTPAQEPSDPAAFLPATMPVYLEAGDVASTLSRLENSPLLAHFDAAARARIGIALEKSRGLGVTRAAAGFTAGPFGANPHWIVLLESPDPRVLAARVESLLGTTKLSIGSLGPFVAVADDPDTLAEAMEAAGGGEKRMVDRPDFKQFRERVRTGSIRIHTNLEAMIPFRFGVGRPKDFGQALFVAHILAVSASAPVLSGSLDLDGGLALRLEAPIGTLSPSRAFAAPPLDGGTILAPPAGCALRLSLP